MAEALGVAVEVLFAVHEGQQGKHVPGHNNYKEDSGRSEFTHEDPEALLERGAGTGDFVGDNKEVVDFNEPIGYWVDRESGEKHQTTRGTIHYGTKGSHIVPAMPREAVPQTEDQL